MATNGSECCICFGAVSYFRFNCGHKVVCRSCSDRIKQCPICKVNITVRSCDMVSDEFVAPLPFIPNTTRIRSLSLRRLHCPVVRSGSWF